MNAQTQGLLKSGMNIAGSALGNMLLPGIGGAIGGSLGGLAGGLFGDTDEQKRMANVQASQDKTQEIIDLENAKKNRMNNVIMNTMGLR